jgi:hypothetical protein
MSAEGYIAMTFGIFFSLAIGIGLMALNFYSRAGYDAPPSPDAVRRSRIPLPAEVCAPRMPYRF